VADEYTAYLPAVYNGSGGKAAAEAPVQDAPTQHLMAAAPPPAGCTGAVSGSHVYTTPGVYTLQLTVTDKDGGQGSGVYIYVVIYDPEGGFVTGGGSIQSPLGAYAPDPTLTGAAHFGFNSKYKKGASVPTGETNFQFQMAGLHFHSKSYQWLVVAGARAIYKGRGTINNAGNYGFILSAIDGSVARPKGPDRFRIKIWDIDAGYQVVYDNQMNAPDDADPTTAITSGNIIVHK
jgi:hypothetical protein